MTSRVCRKDSAQKSVANPKAEREAWKRHFQKVSKGAGKVKERVWQNIPVVDAKDESLRDTPSRKEVVRALMKMHMGKAPGEDEVTVEMLRCMTRIASSDKSV